MIMFSETLRRLKFERPKPLDQSFRLKPVNDVKQPLPMQEKFGKHRPTTRPMKTTKQCFHSDILCPKCGLAFPPTPSGNAIYDKHIRYCDGKQKSIYD